MAGDGMGVAQRLERRRDRVTDRSQFVGTAHRENKPAWAEGTAGAAPPSRAVLTISYRLKLRVAVCDCKPFARATIQNFEETWCWIRRQNRPMKSEAAS